MLGEIRRMVHAGGWCMLGEIRAAPGGGTRILRPPFARGPVSAPSEYRSWRARSAQPAQGRHTSQRARGWSRAFSFTSARWFDSALNYNSAWR